MTEKKKKRASPIPTKQRERVAEMIEKLTTIDEVAGKCVKIHRPTKMMTTGDEGFYQRDDRELDEEASAGKFSATQLFFPVAFEEDEGESGSESAGFGSAGGQA